MVCMGLVMLTDPYLIKAHGLAGSTSHGEYAELVDLLI